MLLRIFKFVMALTIAIPTYAHAQPYERADSFFKKDYLTKPKDPPRDKEEGDSWQAPRAELRGHDVAGSDRVRDYRNREGAFAPEPTPPQAVPYDFQVVPLGDGAAVVLPNQQGSAFSER